MAAAGPQQRELWFADLDPTVGDEIRKHRPVLVLSRNEVNQNSDDGRRVVIVAPGTTTPTPGGVRLEVPGATPGDPVRVTYILPWQVRAISRERLTSKQLTVDREVFARVIKLLGILVSLPPER